MGNFSEKTEKAGCYWENLSEFSEKRVATMATGFHKRQFGRLLSKAIRTIATNEDKKISVIQDEIGYSLRKKNGESYNGGAAIEYWRQGNLPPELSTTIELTSLLVERGGLDEEEREQFLRYAGYPEPKDVSKDLSPLSSPGSVEETSDPGKRGLPNQTNTESEKLITINLALNWKMVSIPAALIIIILMSAAAYLWPSSAEPNLPSVPAAAYVLKAVHVAQAPVIDGRLDDHVWMNAQPLVFAQHPPKNGSTTASVRLLWDEQYLYAGFDVDDTQVEGSAITPWDGDSVSLIIENGAMENEPDKVEYRHSLMGEEVGARKGDLLSNHSLTRSTTYNDSTNEDVGFSVEMRIPWIAPPSVGTLLKIDLLSVDHDNNPDTKYDDPKTVFSKISWDNDNSVDTSGGFLLLADE